VAALSLADGLSADRRILVCAAAGSALDRLQQIGAAANDNGDNDADRRTGERTTGSDLCVCDSRINDFDGNDFEIGLWDGNGLRHGYHKLNPGVESASDEHGLAI
jgi:hypothetical protein